MQVCKHLENYIDAEKWFKIRDPRRYRRMARAHVLADVAASIGIANACEQTRYRVLAILCYGEDCDETDQGSVWLWMGRLSDYINAKIG